MQRLPRTSSTLTNDNPRTEDPMAIARELARRDNARSQVTIILDRARAIHAAVAEARPEDVVLVCGKGHETDQTIGETRHPFSDRAVGLEAFSARKACTP